MHRPILSALVLALVFSSSALTASAQESDFATKRNFESRATALTARIDAAITTAQLDSLKNEIDVLALSDSEKILLAGECMWSAKPVGMDILDDLMRKTQKLLAADRWDQAIYCLFAKSSFTPAVQERAAREGIRLVKIEDLLG